MFDKLLSDLQMQLQYLERHQSVENFVNVQELLHDIESKAEDLIVVYVE